MLAGTETQNSCKRSQRVHERELEDAAKATEETGGFSIDVVDMTGPGPRHRHPNGEVNWCIALEGSPTFGEQDPGWVVESPGSEHVPTVSGGRMLIVYLLPEGAIEFAT